MVSFGWVWVAWIWRLAYSVGPFGGKFPTEWHARHFVPTVPFSFPPSVVQSVAYDWSQRERGRVQQILVPIPIVGFDDKIDGGHARRYWLIVEWHRDENTSHEIAVVRHISAPRFGPILARLWLNWQCAWIDSFVYWSRPWRPFRPTGTYWWDGPGLVSIWWTIPSATGPISNRAPRIPIALPRDGRPRREGRQIVVTGGGQSESSIGVVRLPIRPRWTLAKWVPTFWWWILVWRRKKHVTSIVVSRQLCLLPWLVPWWVWPWYLAFLVAAVVARDVWCVCRRVAFVPEIDRRGTSNFSWARQ